MHALKEYEENWKYISTMVELCCLWVRGKSYIEKMGKSHILYKIQKLLFSQ